MKKARLLLILAALVLALASCTSQQLDTPVATAAPTEDSTQTPPEDEEMVAPIRIATLAGPAGMGLIDIIDDKSGKYETSIYTSPDQIVPKIINNEVDIASVPSNLASVLYNKTNGAIAALSVNTLGVLYIVEIGDTVTELADLAGKTLYATGQGASPEYVLNDILSQNNIDVDIQYLAQHADLANQVVAGDITLALLPEPFVSVVTIKNPDVKVKLALDDAWQALYGQGNSIPMTTTIVNKEFYDNNIEAVEQFLADYQSSVVSVNADKDTASEKIAYHGIIAAAPIAKKAIDGAKISFITGDDAKNMLVKYYQTLFDSNPSSVGGALPGEDFYK